MQLSYVHAARRCDFLGVYLGFWAEFSCESQPLDARSRGEIYLSPNVYIYSFESYF